MLIDKRQVNIGCANIPEISHDKKPDIKGYEKFKDVMFKPLYKKMAMSKWDKKTLKEYPSFKEGMNKEKNLYEDCLIQTISFLKKINAIESVKDVDRIILWKKWIPMKPFYEAVNGQLKTMLVKKHHPRMYKAISGGAVYSHQSLTNIGEIVLYTMEYFEKYKLLKNADDVTKSKEFKDWLFKSVHKLEE